MSTRTGHRPASTWRLFGIIAGAAVTAEVLIMLLLGSVLPHQSVWIEAVLDSALLLATLLPMLYIFMVRPLELQIASKQEAQAALQKAHDELEQRIKERTFNVYEQAQHLATLEERQRLARELHDSLSQALYGIALGAHTAREFLEVDPAKATEALDFVLLLTDAGLTEMRALIFDLRPESLEMEGLVNALSKQAAAVHARYHLEIETEFCEEPEVPFDIKEAIYRVAQEAMHNTVKHAEAKHLSLRLYRDSTTIVLDVSDDGVGFDPQLPYPGHLGLSSMHERALRLGSQLEIDSALGRGTRVLAKFPVPQSEMPQERAVQSA